MLATMMLSHGTDATLLHRRAPRVMSLPPRPPYRRVADFVSVLPLGFAELAFRHGDVAFCQASRATRLSAHPCR
jgi:hypothetical protein